MKSALVFVVALAASPVAASELGAVLDETIEEALSYELAQGGGGGGRVRTGAVKGTRGVTPMGMELGLGLQAGSPTALTLKYMLARDQGIVVGLGAGFGNGISPLGSLHIDYLWHPYIFVRSPPFKLSFYIGAGAWFFFGGLVSDPFTRGFLFFGRSDLWLGVRVPFGLSLALNRLPIEIYLEVTPSMLVFPYVGGFIPGGTLGGRVYF